MSLEKGTAYCGENTLTWSAVKSFNKWNAGIKWLRDLPYVVSMSKKSLTIGDPGSVMLNALLQARHCGATNPRDKVYALLPLLHLSGKQFNITPRYGDSLVKVYTDCGATLIEDHGFEVLYAVQGGPRIDNLPSWVPDWNIPPRRMILGTSSGKSQFCVSKKIDVPQKPQIITSTSFDSNTETISALRVSGYLCGEITKISSTYLADHGLFPLRE